MEVFGNPFDLVDGSFDDVSIKLRNGRTFHQLLPFLVFFNNVCQAWFVDERQKTVRIRKERVSDHESFGNLVQLKRKQ